MDLAETLGVLQRNFLSPLTLAFVLGMIATLVKSDIEFPEQAYKFIAFYLMFAIGLNGGVGLAGTTFAAFALPALATIFLAILLPTLCYFILRGVFKFDAANAAGVAALYGSVSSVTFAAGISVVETFNIGYEGFIPTLAALAEWGIIVALFWGRLGLAQLDSSRAAARRSPGAMGIVAPGLNNGAIGRVISETLRGRSVILLMGGLLIGLIIGPSGFERIAVVFSQDADGLFRGVLVLFLIEMGMVAARQLREFAKVGPRMVAFGTLMPICMGVLGATLGALSGLSLGGTFILAAIAGSASYIDAPAAVRSTFPQANPSIYLTSSLGITLPFNLLLGLPLLYAYSQWFCTAVAGCSVLPPGT